MLTNEVLYQDFIHDPCVDRALALSTQLIAVLDACQQANDLDPAGIQILERLREDSRQLLDIQTNFEEDHPLRLIRKPVLTFESILRDFEHWQLLAHSAKIIKENAGR